MIITRTPFRISFFGGGTDFPDWFKENGGAVLSTAIDKYCYISCRILPPFFEHKHRIVYSLIENVRTPAEIQHPAVRAVLTEMAVTEGVEIHHDGDLPARSGLGSSSSFTVGLLHAVHALFGRVSSKQALAQSAIHIEQTVLAENVGCQDQIAAAYGGLNKIDFHTDASFTVAPTVCPPARLKELEDHLMLFFTGVSRFSSEIAGAQVANMKNVGDTLLAMQAQVKTASDILTDSDVDIIEFGRLLHEAWQLKKTLSDKVSTSKIEEIYDAAMHAGAVGGKILGAGGGGFVLFFVPPAKQALVRDALRGLIHVPFRFERQGSHIAYYNPPTG